MRALIALLLFVLSLSTSYAQEEEPPWVDQQQRLISAYMPKNKFGADSMDMDGNLAVIGTTVNSAEYYWGMGVVVIFERTGEHWAEQTFLLPPEEDRIDDTGFGRTVDVHGDYLAVYAYNKSRPGTDPTIPENTVYVYKRNGDIWDLETKITSMLGAYPSMNISLVGDTLFVEPIRWFIPGAPDVSSIAGYIYERIDGIWTYTETITRPEEAEPVEAYRLQADLLNDGNRLAIYDGDRTTYTFNRTPEGWGSPHIIQPPAEDLGKRFNFYEILFNDRGDNAVVFWQFRNCHNPNCSGLNIYHFDGTEWQLEKRELGTSAGAKIHNDTVVFANYTYYSPTRLPTSSTIFTRIDGQWVKQSTLAIYELPTQNREHMSAINVVETDGVYVITGVSWWNPETIEGGRALYAIKIPGVNQDAPQTVAKANTTLLSVPPALDAIRETGSSDYAIINVSLKTRPTQKVILQLSTNGSALLDVGGPASQILNLTFNRKNWNVPRPVRVRLAPGQSGPLSAVIRERVIDGSALEYKLVKPLSVRVSVPGLVFAPESPAADVILPDNSPVTFTWRPYSLATRYVVKLKRVGSTRQFKFPADPAATCTVDLCTLTLDRTALPKGTAFKWRVVAQDQPAAYQRATPWRKFTLTAPQ
jgi:hypothetical protein